MTKKILAKNMTSKYHLVPDNLPEPTDDGACDHLRNMKLPDMELRSTLGGRVNLSKIEGETVVFIYPMTAQPGTPLPVEWDDIPGARGCTPQACAFRDLHEPFQSRGVSLYGLSTQSTTYQYEASTRLNLPYPLLSDERREYSQALNLPMFSVAGMVLNKRVTLYCVGGIINKAFYPVFPTFENPAEVLSYIDNRVNESGMPK